MHITSVKVQAPNRLFSLKPQILLPTVIPCIKFQFCTLICGLVIALQNFSLNGILWVWLLSDFVYLQYQPHLRVKILTVE